MPALYGVVSTAWTSSLPDYIFTESTCLHTHECTRGKGRVGVLLTFVMVGYQGSDGKEPTSGHQGHKGFSGPRCGLSVDYDPF